MGGKAFESRSLFTPRMPVEVYEEVLVRVQSQLRNVYERVETPIEGPGKTDYGDVDVLVLAKDGAALPSASEVSKVLNAYHSFTITNNATSHFAVPWPEQEHQDQKVNQRNPEVEVGDKHHDQRVRFVQVDVHVCATPQELSHLLFFHGHGDLWTILGSTLRRFGFVSTQSGFHVRIAELEATSSPKSFARVKLSDDPDTILDYLGMDRQKCRSRFGSWDDLMAYAATCRFHDPHRGKQYDGNEGDGNDDDHRDSVPKPKLDDLKAHDRAKKKQRPMFRYWLEEYLPAHRDDAAGGACHLTREEVVDEVKSFFGEAVAVEYERKKAAGLHYVGAENLWSDVRRALPCHGGDLTHAMKGLKFEIVGEQEAAAAAAGKSAMNEWTDVQKLYRDGRYKEVHQWAVENWAGAMSRQVLRDRKQSSAKLVDHLKKLEVKDSK